MKSLNDKDRVFSISALFCMFDTSKDFDKDLDFANGTHSGTKILQSI